jgi:hypothetical protein
MTLPPPTHLGEMKGLLTYEPDDLLAELFPPDEVRSWLSHAGIASIFASPWPGVDVLEDHEVHVIVRVVKHGLGSIPSGQVSVRTARTAHESPAIRATDIEVLHAFVHAALDVIERDRETAWIADEQAIATSIERLVSEALAALREENSLLRAELDTARIRVAFLEGQLHALAEAHATGRRRITKAILGGVAAILLAAATGAAEGFVASAAHHEDGSAVTLARECQRIQHLIERSDDD